MPARALPPVPPEPRPHRGETGVHVGAAVADSETVGGSLGEVGFVDAGRDQEHAGLFQQPGAEALDSLRALVSGKSDAAAVRRDPIEEFRVFGEEVVQLRDVLVGEAPVDLRRFRCEPRLPEIEANHNLLIGGHVLDTRDSALRPSHLDPIHLFSKPESEVLAQVILGKVAGTGADLRYLIQVTADDPDACSNGERILAGSLSPYPKPVALVATIVAKNHGSTVQVINHQIQITIIVQITYG